MIPESPKFSGWLDDIIKVSTSVVPIIFGATQGGGSGGGGQAKGLAAITAFGNRVMAALDDVQAQVSAMPIPQRAQAAQQITQAVSGLVASLSDSAQVYQAQKGKDAAALAKFKTDADAKARTIIALLNASSGGGGVTVTTGGGQSGGAPTGGGQIASADNTLLYAALGVIAVLLITRN